MAYSTQSEIEIAAGGAVALAQLADFDTTSTAALVIAQALEQADDWIDDHLGRYVTPLTDAAQIKAIKGISAEETVYLIRKWRGQLALTPEFAKEHEAREKRLEGYRDGRLLLPDPSARGVIRSAWVEADGDVTRDKLKGQW